MFTNLFSTPANSNLPLRWEELILRLFLAMAMGFAVMFVYRMARKGEPRNASFEVTLVLLAILIAMVTKVIGDSVARAFSLVGALSIVRFRTVVRDTQDTAYVIFAVVVGMAVGANLLSVAIIGILVITIATLLLRRKDAVEVWPANHNSVLNIRVPLGELLDQLSGTLFPKHFEAFQLTSLSTARQGMALEATYNVRLRPGASPTNFVRELNKIDGVQSVELLSSDALSEK
jgi:uncharacterized membrane protein YhiD involved in acid resistance